MRNFAAKKDLFVSSQGKNRYVRLLIYLFVFSACMLEVYVVTGYSAERPTLSGSLEGGGYLFMTEVESHELIQMAYLEERQPDQRREGVSSNPKLCRAAEGREVSGDTDEWEEGGEDLASIPDPLEPLNRAFFIFNDKLYFWVLEPVGTGYKKVVPQLARVSIRNFFSNLAMPIRAVSCLLQGKIDGFGIELVRFVVNSTAGFLGLQDVARQALDMPEQDEDLGQVFAFYGIGPGFYLELPFLGPSSLRGTVGWVGGLFLNPLDYMVEDIWANIGVRAYDMVNETSLRIGEYEAMKKAALDPYIAMRDAYYQYRMNLIHK